MIQIRKELKRKVDGKLYKVLSHAEGATGWFVTGFANQVGLTLVGPHGEHGEQYSLEMSGDDATAVLELLQKKLNPIE